MSRIFLVWLVCISTISAKEYFSGEIKVTDNNIANFSLYDKEQSYFVKISFKDSLGSCDFKVRKISAPAWLRGRNGVIQADEVGCSFKLKNKELQKFWNDTVTIDMAYYFTDEKKMRADVTINSLKKTTKAYADFSLKNKD